MPTIEPFFLTKSEIMSIVGHASIAVDLLMKADSFHVADSKEIEARSLEAVSNILTILLQELSIHAPLIPACEEYVMEKHELAIPYPVHSL